MEPCLSTLAQLPEMAKHLHKTVLRHIHQVKPTLAPRTAILRLMASPQPVLLLLDRTNCRPQPNEDLTTLHRGANSLLHSQVAKAGP